MTLPFGKHLDDKSSSITSAKQRERERERSEK
jgi:hypothetical protein